MEFAHEPVERFAHVVVVPHPHGFVERTTVEELSLFALEEVGAGELPVLYECAELIEQVIHARALGEYVQEVQQLALGVRSHPGPRRTGRMTCSAITRAMLPGPPLPCTNTSSRCGAVSSSDFLASTSA